AGEARALPPAWLWTVCGEVTPQTAVGAETAHWPSPLALQLIWTIHQVVLFVSMRAMRAQRKIKNETPIQTGK
ncbi:MAG: hypothetical protein ABI977_11280, partial [Acidobacteriota bacterium]